MRVGELSQRTGASVRSLRYYEERGLIEADRSTSGQRQYDAAVVDRVLLIRQLLTAGLGTAAIVDVLPCMAEPASQTSLLTARLVAERDRLTDEIAQRVATRDALEQIIGAAPPLQG
ncbi:MerR family transcriptional regulator [Microbacterium sp. NPDC089189]|uniref:MerR family transcriptional regulator n=1 Tax=Microbacterium sp. NPDC089189 TaxID=3154972 RepID=UPI0034137A6D